MNALQKMTPRERGLAAIVAGILFLLANLLILKVAAAKETSSS